MTLRHHKICKRFSALWLGVTVLLDCCLCYLWPSCSLTAVLKSLFQRCNIRTFRPFLFRVGENENVVQMDHVEAEQTKKEGGALPLRDEIEVLESPVETVVNVKDINERLSERPSEVGVELNACSINSSFSVASSDSDSSNVKTCNITDIDHVPVLTAQDVQNLVISPKSKSESNSESMVSELSPDVQAVLSSTPELGLSVTSASARNSRQRRETKETSSNKDAKDDVRTSLEFEAAQEFVNTNSLFAELSSQEPSVIGEIDEGAEISLMGKELESVLKENEELIRTK